MKSRPSGSLALWGSYMNVILTEFAEVSYNAPHISTTLSWSHSYTHPSSNSSQLLGPYTMYIPTKHLLLSALLIAPVLSAPIWSADYSLRLEGRSGIRLPPIIGTGTDKFEGTLPGVNEILMKHDSSQPETTESPTMGSSNINVVQDSNDNQDLQLAPNDDRQRPRQKSVPKPTSRALPSDMDKHRQGAMKKSRRYTKEPTQGADIFALSGDYDPQADAATAPNTAPKMRLSSAGKLTETPSRRETVTKWKIQKN